MRIIVIAWLGRLVIPIGALLLIGGDATKVDAEDSIISMPASVSISHIDEASGRNSVLVDLGDAFLHVNNMTAEWTGSFVRFTVETDDGVAGVAIDGAVHLQPSSRVDRLDLIPAGTVFRSELTIGYRLKRAVVMDLGRGATTTDVVVWLPEERTLVTGSLCTNGRIEVARESDTGAWIANLQRLRDLGPKLVIPGTGKPGGIELIDRQIRELTAVREAVETVVLEGGSIEDAVVAIQEPWFTAWRVTDEVSGDAALSVVFDEISGRRTPRVLLEERGLREGPSPTRADIDWVPPKRVLWRNRWPDRLASLRQVAPGVEIVPFDSAEEALALVKGADALIGTATAELLEAGEELKWVQVGSAGVERYLEFPRLGSGEVLLTNGQRLASEVIGEHAMALLRALARGLNRAVAAQVDGEWRRSEIGDVAPLTQLRGKTMLVVGLGGIGTEVARLADAAGMRVTAIRSSRRSGPLFVAKVGLTEDLAEFVATADVVVNCLPMTPDTNDIFNASLFEVMRETAFFINVGRGGTVDTDALVAALESGAIAGAGLDVTDPEPLPEGHPLWQAPNLVITPHFAAWSDAGRELQWLLFRENLRRFVAGERLLSVVDPTRGY